MKRRDIELDGEVVMQAWVPRFMAINSVQQLADYGSGPLSREVMTRTVARSFTLDPHRQRTLNQNAYTHLQRMSADTSLAREATRGKSRTAILVGSGPSAGGFEENWQPDPNCDVWGLNFGGRLAGKHLSGLFVVESIAAQHWWLKSEVLDGDTQVKGMLEALDPSKVTLVTTPISDLSLLDHWTPEHPVRYGWCVECAHVGIPEDAWGDIPALVSGGTSATFALHGLVEMGYEKIVLIGFDLSAANPERTERGLLDGVFYGDGTRISESYYARGPLNQWVDVRDNRGEVCAINAQLSDYAETLDACILSAQARGVNVLNASWGILNMPHTPLEEAIHGRHRLQPTAA